MTEERRMPRGADPRNPPVVHVCDASCPDPETEDYFALARHHARSTFKPETAKQVIADPEMLTTLARNIRRQARKRAKLAVSSKPAPKQSLVPTTGCYLYRLFASDGRLLYVGVSTRLAGRLECHQRRWGDLIARVTWEEHADERAMLAAERQAIIDEDPALNKAGVG